MTRYLLRWQWTMTKRQLRSTAGLLPLVTTALLEIVIVAMSLTADARDFADGLSMMTLFVAIYALSQVANGYIGALIFMSSGVIGIAPVPGRAKAAMALFALSFNVVLNAVVLSVGAGVALSIRYTVGGGLLAAVLVFFSSTFVLSGLGVAYSTWVMNRFPPKYRKAAGAFVAASVMILFPVRIWLDRWNPRVADAFGYALIHLAQQPLHSAGQVTVLVGAGLTGLALAAPPLLGASADRAAQITDHEVVDGRLRRSSSAPAGHARLLLWREWIAWRRQKPLWLILLIFPLFNLLPGPLSPLWTLLLGVQMGGLALQFGPPRSLGLILAAPIDPVRFWRLRMLSLAPFVAAPTVVMLLTHAVIVHRLSVVAALGGIALAALGLSFVSWMVVYFGGLIASSGGRSKARRPGRRRLFQYTLLPVISVLGGLAPIGLAMFNTNFPAPGLALDAVLLAAVLLLGPVLIRRKSTAHRRRASAVREFSAGPSN